MVKHVYLKPQKNNPRGLTINQHVFPLASISRFANADGRISLCDITLKKIRQAKPNDSLLCAKRAWDQRAETLFMRKIENDFQNIVSKIIDGTLSECGPGENHVANLFYALWHVRSRQRTLTTVEIQATGLIGSSFTPEQEENLEKTGYAFAREGGKFLSHHLNGIQIQVKTGQFARTFLKGSSWGIIQAHKGEFIVPDIPSHFIIPITPTLCLMNRTSNGIITEQNVAEINRSVRAESQRYYFAHDLSLCHFNSGMGNGPATAPGLLIST